MKADGEGNLPYAYAAHLICYVAAQSRTKFVMLRSHLFRLAAMGALGLALTLGGCGRKGPLDAPPSTTAAVAAPGAQTAAGPEASPQATPRRKRIFLDWLLD